MNGRMYDAQQGRFLSPDNHIQDPFNTQNFNRFGYVLNNPLSLTDPSGEFIATLFAIVKVVSLIMTAAQTLIAIASGAPIGQVLIGIGIGVLAGLAGGALATGIKGVFSAATTAVGAFVRGAISAFGGQLISGTLASVAQGTSFRKALRANFAPAGISAAIAAIAGASEFNKKEKALAVAKAKRMVPEELDAMAEEAYAAGNGSGDKSGVKGYVEAGEGCFCLPEDTSEWTAYGEQYVSYGLIPEVFDPSYSSSSFTPSFQLQSGYIKPMGFDSPFFAPSLALKSLSGGLGKVPKFFNSLRITNPNALTRTTFGYSDEVVGSIYRTGRGPLQNLPTHRPRMLPMNSHKYNTFGRWSIGIGTSSAAGYYYYRKLFE